MPLGPFDRANLKRIWRDQAWQNVQLDVLDVPHIDRC
jgi:hypothetical protein